MNRYRFCGVLTFRRLVFALALAVLASAGHALYGGAMAAEGGNTAVRAVSSSGNDSARDGNYTPRKSSVPVEGTRIAPALAAPSSIVRVGLLLPLTGRSAEVGRAMQDAATVALFDKYAQMSPQFATTRVELLPKDTGDTPQQAKKAMEQAIAARVDLVIGPLFSEATAAITPLALEKKIPVISFSNNVVNAKPGIYTFGFSLQEQTARVVAFAAKKGKGRIAALVPHSGMGDTVVATANASLNNLGTKLFSVGRYAPQGVGIDQALNELVPGGNDPGFDALLLIESGMSLSTMLRAMEARGIKPPAVQLLGTGIWDDAALIRRANLDGAWLASSPPASTALFEKRFIANYGYTPPRISSLAYDAVSLAVTLATSGRGFSEAALTNPAGFNGPGNGNFRLNPDGTVERSLAVLKVNGAGFSVMELAPSAFSGVAAEPSPR